ncbi:type II toxin-antitoxin system prevent-host-death family antitoxin [Streptacidiphilus sp. EB103A]|uniref:type II toxin-antitoxin system prevent-host-death family antitoxin n=1 Tax=Streptacidiphilus sp. EB103A TaxID=3156275 RepID=UPI0035169AFD
MAVDELVEDLRTITEQHAIASVTGLAAVPAVRAASPRLDLPTIWLTPGPSTDRGAMARALYAGLHLDAQRPRPRAMSAMQDLIAAELRRSTRLVAVVDAHRWQTPALELLYGLWSPAAFPLVLVGDNTLDAVLRRPRLASLRSCIFIRHRLDVAQSAPTADSAVDGAPTLQAAAETAATVAPDAAPPIPATAAGQTVRPLASVAAAGTPEADTAPHARGGPRAVTVGVATGLHLPAPSDPLWGAIPVELRQNLRAPAHQLVNPARGALADKAGRPLRVALAAAASMRTTGAHWRTLLTAPRPAFGGSGSARAQRAYEQLELVVATFVRPAMESPDAAARAASDTPAPRARPTRVKKPATDPKPAPSAAARVAPSLGTTPADNARAVPDADRATGNRTTGLQGPATADLGTEPVEPGQSTAAPRPSAEPARAADAITASHGPAAPIHPRPDALKETAPLLPTAIDSPTPPPPAPIAPAGQRVPAPAAVSADPKESSAPAPAAAPSSVPVPATLHEARAALPHLIRAAAESGTATPLSRGTHHALLVAPATATALGWNLATAEAHGIADARKKLGDLIQHAAQGHPQVLRRHVTPAAVLLPIAPDGTALPAALLSATELGKETVTDQPVAATEPTAEATAQSAALGQALEDPSTCLPATKPQSGTDRLSGVSATTTPTPTPRDGNSAITTPAAPAVSSGPAPAGQTTQPAAPPQTTLSATAAAAAADTLFPSTPPEPAPAGTAAHTMSTADAPPLAPTLPPAAEHTNAGTHPELPADPPAPASTRRRLARFSEALDAVLTTPDPLPDARIADEATATPLRGLPIGIPSLDQALGGLQPGRCYLVAADPGTGGSLLATAAARTAALDHHQAVLYAASGLTRADIAARIVAAHLPVDYRRLRAGHLNADEQADVTALQDHLAAAPLYIDDGTDLTPAAITESAADLPDLALVIVDRLQAADDPRLPLSGPRLTDAVQALAHLARTHHLPVLAVLDTTNPRLLAALGLDLILTLAPDPEAGTTTAVRLTITERDLGTQTTLTLRADPVHARLTDPVACDPYKGRNAPTTADRDAPTAYPSQPTPPTAALPTTAVPARPTQPTNAPEADPTINDRDQPQVAPGQRPARVAAPRRTGTAARPTAGGGYANRDYSYYTGMVTGAVEQALQEHGGDIQAATEALLKKAVPNAMEIFQATRVGGNYDHTVYPELPEFLRKKVRDGADGIWEGRHNWNNQPLLDQLRAGTLKPALVEVLDTNAAFLSSFKTHLPIGALVHDPLGGHDPKRSGIYLLHQRPAWNHPQLPDPIGNRQEPGEILLDEATIRLLIRCSRLDLCDAPVIAECWTSGASEGLLEKFRRVLTESRETALARMEAGYADATVTIEYIKAMYSKFTSTMGESSANRDIRRPEWMHTVRSQAFANLWYKGYKAHEAGLTIVRMRGTDELHVTGGEWRILKDRDGGVFEEGRLTHQMKLKRQYTLPGGGA